MPTFTLFHLFTYNFARFARFVSLFRVLVHATGMSSQRTDAEKATVCFPMLVRSFGAKVHRANTSARGRPVFDINTKLAAGE